MNDERTRKEAMGGTGRILRIEMEHEVFLGFSERRPVEDAGESGHVRSGEVTLIRCCF